MSAAKFEAKASKKNNCKKTRYPSCLFSHNAELTGISNFVQIQLPKTFFTLAVLLPVFLSRLYNLSQLKAMSVYILYYQTLLEHRLHCLFVCCMISVNCRELHSGLVMAPNLKVKSSCLTGSK